MFRTICTVAWIAVFVVAALLVYMHHEHMTKTVMIHSLLTILTLLAVAPALFVQTWIWVFRLALLACVVAGLCFVSVFYPLWSVIAWALLLTPLTWLARKEYLDTPHPRDTSLTGIKIPKRGVVMISMAGRTPRDINEEIRCYRRNAKKCS
jgi:hypothetical protein|tara:strand:+ start:533306 stop:533758 length:453 start_codon:yes stop_codon:yes gene_type:complete